MNSGPPPRLLVPPAPEPETPGILPRISVPAEAHDPFHSSAVRHRLRGGRIVMPHAEPVGIPPATDTPRVRVDGKFFRQGTRKFHPKGVTYGPFAPNTAGEPFPDPDDARRDLTQVCELGANLLRVYHVPPRWFLDLAAGHGLRVLVDVPWNKHLCFLDAPDLAAEAREAVREAARRCARHPAVFALSVVNEIPADIVRWSGAAAVAGFIDELIAVAKAEDPELLCTFGNFPPTEFLRPRRLDFCCWNLYLHQPRPFENYLARLQMLADTRPLVLGEFGLDSLRETEAQQAETLGWQIESAFRAGCAGVICFAFTDDWFKDGRAVDDWAFGLVTRDRRPKPAFETVRRQFVAAPRYPLPHTPRVSVVVASYNGDATLRSCLQSLEALNYPDYEVLLVDDGSTDSTPAVASEFPAVRYFRHAMNQGLGVARNTGIAAATGEIVAFTDSDCRPDEDWLRHLVGDLLNSRFVGIGGHNFLPPDDAPTAACVMVSPGGPAHVMLTDRIAEHIPGCNMAFYKWALESVGGFDPIYRTAGDDVDICWRLQQRNYRIGFSAAGFVWHYRRNTVGAYLRQQSGYGAAEALLERRHPENFNRFGGSIWHGRIYSPAKFGVETRAPIIYHGLFGSAFFQSIYATPPSLILVVPTSLEYHVLVTLPLLVLGSVVPHLASVGLASLCFSLAMCGIAAGQAELPPGHRRWWSRPLVALLFFLQPIVRGWARHQGHLRGQQRALGDQENLNSLILGDQGDDLDRLLFWSESGMDRMVFLGRVLERLDQRKWPNKPDAGWSPYDVEIYGSRWACLQLTTAGEWFPGRREMIRCRLKARWSFLARALFWSVAGFTLVLIGTLTGSGSWLLLLALPLLAWWLDQERRNLTRVTANFLIELAKECQLVQVDSSRLDTPRDASPRGTSSG
ncbi:MAG: glycosyltransferase [Verrucomicrobiae bacterium]|nr:glycosyltransferase [Verrucomicrobiae bacterium]